MDHAGRYEMSALSPRAPLDAAVLKRLADWLVVFVAIALPWSISALAICTVAWLLAVLPTLDPKSVRHEILSAAGGLPVLLWCLGVLGMLWADVSWTERVQGLGSFHRLLVIPLLLAQFRRSDHGMRVIYGFVISSALVIVATYALRLIPGLTWHGPKGTGFAAHDDIFQGTLVIICGFGALGYAGNEFAKRHWAAVFALIAVAALFFAYFLIVIDFSRGVIVVAAVLAGLLGWRLDGWRGLLVACILAAAVSLAFWYVSSNFRDRVDHSIGELQEYLATDKATPIGQHLAFLTEARTLISRAPIIGHGTGSIAEQFRQITSGRSGAPGVATVNPHNQTFAIAIQTGLVGATVLWLMWAAHLRLFHRPGMIGWLGTVVVVENIISSAFHSHLFDSTHGWLYVFGVGVLGGMALDRQVESDSRR